MLFISDAQYYAPAKSCKTEGSIHLFKITGKVTPENVKLKRNILWEVIELDGKEVNMTLNGNKIIKIRCIVKWEPLLFHIMPKQGMTWFPLASNDSPETAYIWKDILPEMACELAANCDLIFGILTCSLPEDTIDMDLKVHTLWGIHTYEKDRGTQVIKCIPWGTEVKCFPSLQKKMMEYLRWRKIIATPFANRSYQPRPKATAIRRSNLVPITRPNRERLSQP